MRTELEEQETQLMTQVSNLDNQEKLTVMTRITAALLLLKSKDRRRWHHKPIYHVCIIAGCVKHLLTFNII
jgi:hypothetical protein